MSQFHYFGTAILSTQQYLNPQELCFVAYINNTVDSKGDSNRPTVTLISLNWSVKHL